MKLFYFLTVIFLLTYKVKGDVCEGPKTEVLSYSTNDATIVTRIAFLADFSLQCSNGAKDVVLYAETNNGISAVARSLDGSRYQVSWLEDVDAATSGERSIRLFDEAGYSVYKKAQRNGESTSSVAPITTLSMYHRGPYKGPWIQSETLAILTVIGVFYYASTQKSVIMA